MFVFNFDQILKSRQARFEMHIRTTYKVGGNIRNKRLETINEASSNDRINITKFWLEHDRKIFTSTNFNNDK